MPRASGRDRGLARSAVLLLLKLACYAGAYAFVAWATDKPALPPLHEVLASASYDQPADLPMHLWFTVKRWLGVYLLGVLIGVPAGVAVGFPRSVHGILKGDLDFFRSLPATALVTFVIAIMGVRPASLAFPAFYITVFTVVYYVAKHAASLKRRRIEHLREMDANWFFVVWNAVLLELIEPTLIAARQALSLSFLVMISVELIVGSSGDYGLGTSLYDAKFYTKYDDILAHLLWIGVVGYAMNRAGEILHRVVTPWEDPQTG